MMLLAPAAGTGAVLASDSVNQLAPAAGGASSLAFADSWWVKHGLRLLRIAMRAPSAGADGQQGRASGRS